MTATPTAIEKSAASKLGFVKISSRKTRNNNSIKESGDSFAKLFKTSLKRLPFMKSAICTQPTVLLYCINSTVCVAQVVY